jgi:transcriptional regulator with XRE-family HTH domain
MIIEKDKKELKRFGENLKKIRLEAGLSLRQLAQSCTIDHSDISKIEKGETNITLLTGIQLARALQISLSSLYNIQYNEQ